MSDERFIVETVEITDCDTDKSRIAKVITDTRELYSYDDLYELCDDINKLNDENRELRRDLENSYGANATLERVIFKLGEMNAQYREQLMKIPENIREVWLE